MVGPVPLDTSLILAVGRPLRNEQDLRNRIVQISDPSSSQYRKYLTPDLFATAYGPDPTVSGTLLGFLQSNGFTMTETFTSNQLVDVRGTVASIENTFFLNLNFYQRADGSVFYAPDRQPSLNLDASTIPILYIGGLDDLAVLRASDGSAPVATVPPNPSSFLPTGLKMYWGNDFRNAYLPNISLTGLQQTVALIESTSFFPIDIMNYESASTPPLPNVPLKEVPVDNFTTAQVAGFSTSEATLDIDMAISMAPGLDDVYVYEEGGATFDGVFAKIANPPVGITLSNQISCSLSGFGFLDRNLDSSIEQFAVQGQSFFMASGDVGAYVGAILPNPPFVNSSVSFMTVVGGTQLTTGANAMPWLLETTWNDTFKQRGHPRTQLGWRH